MALLFCRELLFPADAEQILPRLTLLPASVWSEIAPPLWGTVESFCDDEASVRAERDMNVIARARDPLFLPNKEYVEAPTATLLAGPPNRVSSLQTTERSSFLRVLASGAVPPLIGRRASAHPGKRRPTACSANA